MATSPVESQNLLPRISPGQHAPRWLCCRSIKVRFVTAAEIAADFSTVVLTVFESRMRLMNFSRWESALH